MKDAFTGLQGFRCIVDYIVIYDRNVSEHIVHMHQFLIRCTDMHIAGQMQVHATHGHFHLLAQEYQVHQSVTEAISYAEAFSTVESSLITPPVLSFFLTKH